MGRVAPYPGGEPGGKRPVLDLSGPKLRAAFETLVKASEPIGGIEAFAEALKLKSQLLQERLADGRLAALDRMAFENMCVLMATARRRIGRLLDAEGWPRVRAGIADLIADADMPGTADARLLRFRKSFGEGRERRFVRDLAAEILHNLYPEHYPLMTRWVWDAKANTGALREIWHGEDVDRMVIAVPTPTRRFWFCGKSCRSSSPTMASSATCSGISIFCSARSMPTTSTLRAAPI